MVLLIEEEEPGSQGLQCGASGTQDRVKALEETSRGLGVQGRLRSSLARAVSESTFIFLSLMWHPEGPFWEGPAQWLIGTERGIG